MQPAITDDVFAAHVSPRRMCRLIRKHLPQASIVIGGHIANIADLQRWYDFDHVVRVQGVFACTNEGLHHRRELQPAS